MSLKIVEINYSDIVGRAFNGYDLHLELKNRGVDINQIVLDKRSTTDSVIPLKSNFVFHQQLMQFEKEHSVHNLIVPYDVDLQKMELFQAADIIHYHILHNGMISLFSYPKLMKRNCVWTIHDPWVITGNCIHPLECDKWRNGCGQCNRLDESYFELDEDNTNFMWNLKKKIFQQMDPHIIVATDFMKKYLTNSPLTRHFRKIQIIPFGVDVERYEFYDKSEVKKKFNIPDDKTVIGFRAEDSPIKGNKFLYDALRRMQKKRDFYLLAIGAGHIPDDIQQTYNITEFGWLDNDQEIIKIFTACDIFVMPSLAETFGMMAVEAMAAQNVVVSFKGTVLEEITHAPEIGVSVEYKSVDALAEKLMYLMEKKQEVKWRKRAGLMWVKQHYRFDTYVSRHLKVYENIMHNLENERGS